MTTPNPKQEGTEKRLLIAIVLSMAVLFVTPYLFQKFYPTPPAPPRQRIETPKPEAQKREESEAAKPAPEQAAADLKPAGEQPPTAARPRVVEIENADLILRWNNMGAVLESAKLKRYQPRREEEPASPEKRWVPEWLELIPQQLPATMPKPLSLRLGDRTLESVLAKGVYEVRGAGGNKVKGPAEITFEYRGDRAHVVKKIRVPASGYRLEMQTDVRVGGESVPFSVLLGPGVGDFDPRAEDEFGNRQIVYYHSDDTTRYSADDLEATTQLELQPRWAGLDTKYFAYLVLDSGGIRSMKLQSREWKWKGPEGKEQTFSLLSAELGLEKAAAYSLFLGPKDYEVLQRVDPTLTAVINYGWFAILVWPLLFALKFIYQFVLNYGWAIIILTFVINLVLFPLRYKQMVSMKKMAELQPKMKSIQEKYKRMKRDDPRRQQMNVEVMELYKQHGVNPMGGCLPLVVQMPFLFAFYQMLDASIELRGAPFLGWIQDLSRHDPYYITPIVMGATMVIQQVMTPGTTADPTQRRMMMFLPVIFTFLFLNLSSGLVIYFLFSNVFAMIFQVLLQRWRPELATKGKKN